MTRLIWLTAAFAAALACPLTASTSGSLLPAHSHWDDPNTNYEIQACYIPIAASAGAGSTYGWIPFRERDSQNFMQLELHPNGFVMKRRVSGTFTTIVPSFSTTHNFPLGTDIMFDLVAQGSTFTLYQLNADKTRGARWYQWSDSTFPTGVNVSYYTQGHYYGEWEFVQTKPLDNVGVGHQISGMFQDARNVTGSGNTFDPSTPASGGVTGITQAKNGSNPTFGLASGANYLYTVTVDKPGTGHFDFRDPASNSNGTGSYFTSSFYRLTLGTTPQIQRYVGSSASTTYKAPSGSGTAGKYTLTLHGGTITLTSPAGKILVTVTDGGPQSGVRVRVAPGDQTWTWTGAPQ